MIPVKVMDKRIKYKNFNKYGTGFIWVENLDLRIETAFKIIKRNKQKWEKVAWVSSKNNFNTPEYFDKIKRASKKLFKNIKFYSIEHLSVFDDVYLDLFNLASEKEVFCVVDESNHFKNTYSGRTKRLVGMSNKFKYKLLLSSNPFCRSIRDIYAQLLMICPKDIDATEVQFLHRYMPWYTDDFEITKRWSKPKLERKLMKQWKKFIMFCNLDKPVKINYQDKIFELTKAEKKAYKEDKLKFLSLHSHVAYLQISHRFQYFYTICAQKVAALQKQLAEIVRKNEKVIIYLKYLSEIKFLRESGILNGYQYVVFSGMVDKRKSVSLVGDNVQIIICTYKVNIPLMMLHNVKNLIYFSQTFDYKDKQSALLKLDVSSYDVINVYDYWVNTKLENMIRNNLLRKQKMLENIRSFMMS